MDGKASANITTALCFRKPRVLGVLRAAALFHPGTQKSPRAAAGTRGHGPPPPRPMQHGLYVVDVGDGEHRPVSTRSALDRLGPCLKR